MMAKYFPEMLAEHQNFIKETAFVFYCNGTFGCGWGINLSPKGYDTLRILSSTEIAYLDLTGSGNETSGHINEKCPDHLYVLCI